MVMGIIQGYFIISNPVKGTFNDVGNNSDCIVLVIKLTIKSYQF